MKYLIITIITFGVLYNSEIKAQYWESPKREYRAVWMTTIENLDWPKTKIKFDKDIKRQQDELILILDSLKKYNINTVLLQTRIRGDVIYPSDIEPFSSVFTGVAGKYPGYDPLAFAIEECHKRGMQLHAWLVTLPIGKKLHVKSHEKTSLLYKRPELCKFYKGSWYMEPGEPKTSEYLTALVAEIVKNYNIDGVHLDYIRYPDRPREYNDYTLYRRYGKKNRLADWRRSNITNIVRKIYYRVKEIKPWVKVSCAPLGKHDDLGNYSSKGWNAYNTVFQEAQKWLDEGIMDILFPMMYFSGNDFYPFMLDWQENSYSRHISPGMGVYRLLESEGDWNINEVRRQFFTSRDAGTSGIAMFRTEHLLKNTKGVADFLKIFYRCPAMIPEMTWVEEEKPVAPENFAGIRSNDTLYLCWSSVYSKNNMPAMKYNIYKSDSFPVDVENPNNLIACNIKDTVFAWSDLESDAYWAVTASNAYEMESPPSVWRETVRYSLKYRNSFLLPEEQRWGTRVLIKDVKGDLILSAPYNKDVNVEKLPAGCYRLEIMSREGGILQRDLFTR